MERWTGPNFKPSRAESQAGRRADKAKRRLDEEAEKRKVRARDKYCRFPLCGCGKLRLPLEVSHQEHKGMGGNPEGDRSKAHRMILLCRVRHQDSVTSIHRGSLRIEALDPDVGMAGPVRFQIRDDGTGPTSGCWIEVARERRPHVLEDLETWQRAILENLSDMDE